VNVPPVSLVHKRNTHRLVPCAYRENAPSVLARLTTNDDDLACIFELDHATNDRLLAENDRALGIGVPELVFGVPFYRTINAAFCHPHPLGARFNGPDRGAWYAAFELQTAEAEVVHHKTIALQEIGVFEDEVTYDDYLSDVTADLHDLRSDSALARRCLQPDDYRDSQALAETLLEAGALGVVFPSVRRPAGTCIALFRPALVSHVRRGKTLRLIWNGKPQPRVTRISGGA